MAPTDSTHPRKDTGSFWHSTRETSISLKSYWGSRPRCLSPLTHDALLLGMPHPPTLQPHWPSLKAHWRYHTFSHLRAFVPCSPCLESFLPSPHKLCLSDHTWDAWRWQASLSAGSDILTIPSSRYPPNSSDSMFVLISVCCALTGQRHRL